MTSTDITAPAVLAPPGPCDVGGGGSKFLGKRIFFIILAISDMLAKNTAQYVVQIAVLPTSNIAVPSTWYIGPLCLGCR